MKRIIGLIIVMLLISTSATYAALWATGNLPKKESVATEKNNNDKSIYIEIKELEGSLIKGTVMTGNEDFEKDDEIIISYRYNIDITQFMKGTQIEVQYEDVLDGVISANELKSLVRQL